MKSYRISCRFRYRFLLTMRTILRFLKFVRARSRPYRRVFGRPIRHFAAFFVLFLMSWLKFLKKVVAMPEIHEKVVAMPEIL